MLVGTAKIIAILALGLGSFITGMLPCACVSERTRQRHPLTISCLLCFGAGVLLSTSLTHMLPEAREKLPQYTELLLCVGFFIVYFVDELVHFFYGAGGIHEQQRPTYGTEQTSLLRPYEEPRIDGEMDMRDKSCGDTDNPRMCHVSHTAPCNKSSSGFLGLLCALFVHSLLEGLAIGLQRALHRTGRGPRGTVHTYALLDDGSTVSLIDEEFAENIGAVGPTAPVQVRGINSVAGQATSQRVQVNIQGQGDVHTITARTIADLNLHKQTLCKSILELDHLKELGASTYTAARPRLLIGADNWHMAIAKDVRIGRRREPAAVNTELGWVIYGTVPRMLTRNSSGEVALFIHTALEDTRLDDLVKSHFDIDALGVSLAVKERPANERARRIFEETVRNVMVPFVGYKGDHYETGLPWKNDADSMPPTYNMALERLRGVEKKMRRDPDFARQYEEQVKNLFEKGYACSVEGNELASPRAWVLPHFAVKNINKPGKIRLVFDAAAKSQGKCLNDFLLDGPDLLRSLPGILFRFREGRYAVTADIEEMFLRIKIRPEDQPAQMFLWRSPCEETGPPGLYKMTSLIFGASSSPFLAHCVRNINADRHHEEFPQARDPIQRSHYMDDYVDSYNTEEEAIDIAIVPG